MRWDRKANMEVGTGAAIGAIGTAIFVAGLHYDQLDAAISFIGAFFGAAATVYLTLRATDSTASIERADEAAEIRRMLTKLSIPANMVKMPGQPGDQPGLLVSIVQELRAQGPQFRQFGTQALEWSRHLRFSERAMMLRIFERLDDLSEAVAPLYADPPAVFTGDQQVLPVIGKVIHVATEVRALDEALSRR